MKKPAYGRVPRYLIAKKERDLKILDENKFQNERELQNG